MTPQLTSIGSHRGESALIDTELQPKGCATVQPSKLTTKQRPSSSHFLMQQRTGPRHTSHTTQLHTKVFARVNATHCTDWPPQVHANRSGIAPNTVTNVL